MSDRVFIDTNILIYGYSQDESYKGLPTKKISNSQGSRGSNSRVESINWDNLISGSL